MKSPKRPVAYGLVLCVVAFINRGVRADGHATPGWQAGDSQGEYVFRDRLWIGDAIKVAACGDEWQATNRAD